jgi:hypothetical protein
MRVDLYYHLANFPEWEALTEQQISRVIYSGLWGRADRIHFQLHYEPHVFKDFIENCRFMQDPRVTYTLFHQSTEHYKPSFRPLGECYSIIELHEHALASTERRAVFRFSNKGAPHLTKDTRATALQWNQYIEYWNIDKWQLCLAALEAGFDTVGANWHTPGDPTGHWSGTWWWAATDYLRRLPPLKEPHTVGMQNQLGGFTPRHDAEVWIGQGYPRRLELDHYEHAVVYHVDPPEAKNYKLSAGT